MLNLKSHLTKIDGRLLRLIKQLRYSALGFYFIGFLIPIISYLELDIGGIELGVVISLRTAGFAASSLLAGYLSNKRSLRAWLILGASIGRFISYVILYISFLLVSYWMMMVGMLILGLGAGFFWTPFQSTIADATEYEYRSEAFGIFSQQSGIGGFAGATIGFTILGFAYGASLPNAVAFCPLLIYGVSNIYAGIRVMQLSPQVEYIDIEEKEIKTKVTKRAVIYSFSFLLIILFAESLIGALVGPFIQYYLLENITQNIIYILFAYVPGSVLSIILAPRLGRIADRLNPKYTLGIISVIGAIMTWLLINSTEVWQFSVIFLVDSTVVATASLMLTKIISTVSKERRGTIFGLHDSVTNLGHIIGPLGGGALWDVDSKYPFIVSIVVEGFLALLYPLAIIIIGKNVNLKNDTKTKTEELQHKKM